MGLLILTILTLSLLSTSAAAADFQVTRVASGLSAPLFVTAPPGDTARLFIVEKNSGNIKILNLSAGAINPVPFLTVGNISTSGERGLLGLAFHPDFATNGFFYVNVTDSAGDTNVRRYSVTGNPDLADPGSSHVVIKIDQPFSNHNGGWLGFGPDGFLYIASGDGGSGNDPGNRAQNLNELLGKILRIDVNGDDFREDLNRNYAIPPSNPFAQVVDAADEIWAYGLRNPWRMSFDRATGDLYLGDVGQNAREEIDFQPADSSGGENYGWRLREGTIATPTGGVGGPPPPGNVDPIYDYLHGSGEFQGNSVTGGYVYRGPVGELQGKYFFGDFISEQIWSFERNGSAVTNLTNWTAILVPDSGSINDVVSFGEDDAGNLYIVDLSGEIFRIESTSICENVQGDCNEDGAVTSADVTCTIIEIFNPVGNPCADCNGDGSVTSADVTCTILCTFGTCP